MSMENSVATTASIKLIVRECLVQSNCLVILASTLFIFVIDLNLPLGVAAGVPYVLVVFASLWISGINASYVVAALGIAFTVAGFFLSPGIVVPMHIVLINRTLTVLLIVCAAIMVIRIKKANINISALMNQVLINPVSGFKNKQAFEDEFANEILRCKRYEHQLSLAIIEFKDHSDSQPNKSNREIKCILQEIRNGIRKTDLPYHISDTELAIIFTDTDLATSKSVCEAIYKQVLTKLENRIAAHPVFKIGIAAAEKKDNEATLFIRAKSALSLAKSDAENTVVTIPQVVNKDKAAVAAILLRSRGN